jgi:hypothetical protein
METVPTCVYGVKPMHPKFDQSFKGRASKVNINFISHPNFDVNGLESLNDHYLYHNRRRTSFHRTYI